MGGFTLTPEQVSIVEHEGSAFISACPGAGKTHCIVERARSVLSRMQGYRGLAFLSFTNTAVSELQERIAIDRLLSAPHFPHFVGTFDSFIWNYLVQPFGLNGCENALKVIPDAGDLVVRPYPGARGLRLGCFDRLTGKIIPDEARKAGFKDDPTRHERAVQHLRERLYQRGQLDFDDVRRIAISNLSNQVFSDRLGRVLGARFQEIIVDEAQDCNPDDLAIIDWLRDVANIPTKIVCDPHQSIYGFRGGVSDELFEYANKFDQAERLPLTGNFRSSRNICRVVHMLRAPSQRGDEDQALGELKDCDLDVHMLSYSGQGVSEQIGGVFTALAANNGLEPKNCRLTAKTRSSGLKAIGAYTELIGQSLSLRLADAVMKFHHAEAIKDLFNAITVTHQITMIVAEKLNGRTYHQMVSEDNLEALRWRGQIVKILRSLRFDASLGHTRSEWIARARKLMSVFLPATGAGTIAQKLRNLGPLDDILGSVPTLGLCARTIHEVKGRQFEGICVVLTSAKAKGIVTHLEEEPDDSMAEDARELYVAASRARKLLVIACPRSQAKRLAILISSSGATVQFTEI
jgi:DNA helicase-2/ATP-dependent DNA helicase PcrA